MPFTIQLETENQTILQHIETHGLLEQFIPDSTDQEYRLLKYIDRYGDTTFNSLQMVDLEQDLVILKTKATHPPFLQFLDELIELTYKCKEGIHLYLKFLGD